MKGEEGLFKPSIYSGVKMADLFFRKIGTIIQKYEVFFNEKVYPVFTDCCSRSIVIFGINTSLRRK